MVSFLGILNIFVGENRAKETFCRLMPMILFLAFVSHLFALKAWTAKVGFSGGEAYILVYIASIFLGQLVYSPREYIKSFRDLIPLYTIILFEDIFISTMLYSAFLFATKRDKCTHLAASFLCFAAVGSLTYLWSQQYANLSLFIALGFLFLRYLKDAARTREFEMNMMAIIFLAFNSLDNNQNIFYALLIILSVNLIRRFNRFQHISTIIRLLSFVVLVKFEILTMPVIMAYALICLEPIVTSNPLKKFRIIHYELSSHIIVIFFYFSFVFIYLLTSTTIVESLFMIMSAFIVLIKFSFGRNERGIFKEDLAMITLFGCSLLVGGING
ncbi:MAG: hypothetical protein CME65_12385 [Halobacteriovoraceae bacterium]|nr:hypothetical protein [Halobacteriovoraceae bacterium]